MGSPGEILGYAIGSPGTVLLSSKTNAFKKSTGAGTRASTNADKALADAALEILSTSRDTRNTFFSQLAEALNTGQVGARLPEVQSAVEGALQAGSTDKRNLSDALAVGNLNRTPFGQQQLASQELAARQKVQTTPADVTNAVLLQAPNASISQQQATGLSGLGTLAGISTNQRIASIANNANVYQSVGQGVGGLAGIAGTSYADYARQQQFGKLFGGAV